MSPALTTEQRIMAAIMGRGEPMKVSVLARHLSYSETTIRKAVKSLTVTGILIRTQEGTYEMAASKKATATKEAPVSPRGKRPSSVERDDAVFNAIKKAGKDGIGKADLATAVGQEPGITYLSVWRLQKEGRVAIKRVDGSRTPVYVVA
jgi:biotin operon repressor